MFKKNLTKKIAYLGIISALYVVLSLAFLPLSSGAVQVRISEGLTILPLFIPESIIGLFLGCFFSNLICGCAVFDVVFGSLITMISAIFTYFLGILIKDKSLRFILGALPPILFNAFLLPLVWLWCYNLLEYAYFLQVLFLFLGECVSVYVVGFFVQKGTEQFILKK